MGMIFNLQNKAELSVIAGWLKNTNYKELTKSIVEEAKEQNERSGSSYRQERPAKAPLSKPEEITLSAKRLIFKAYEGDKDIIEGLTDALKIDVASSLK